MKIGLIGTFDVENYGDCLFPELWAHLARGRWPDAIVDLHSPTARPADILTARTVNALPSDPNARFRSPGSEPYDALVLCGGETLGLRHTAGTYVFPTSEYSAYLRLWLSPMVEAAAARRRGGKAPCAIIHACGMAPPRGDDAFIAAAIALADRVALRDEVSRLRLADSIPAPDLAARIGLAVDPMFTLDRLLPPDRWRDLASAGLPSWLGPGEYLAVQVSKTYLKAGELPAFADRIAIFAQGAGKPLALVPCCHFLDDELLLSALGELLSARGVKNAVIRGRVNVKQTAAILGAADSVVSTSLHAAVTGIAFARPVAVLAHSLSGKHQGTLALAGVEGAVATSVTDLDAALAYSRSLDLPKRRADIGLRVEEGLRKTFSLIEDEHRAPFAGPDEIFAQAARLMAQERAAVAADRMLRVKRLLLPSLRKLSVVEAWRRKRTIMRISQPSPGQGAPR